jgi:predicted RNA-binding Zn-ribbon protein involved in translation (DUF1610 family)
MAHLTLIESTAAFVLLIAGIYASAWGLWFLRVRFGRAKPFVRQMEPGRSQDRVNPASLLNEYLKRRRDAQASGRCPSCGKALVVVIDRKGEFSKPECPECSAKVRRQSMLRGRQR